MSVRLDPAPARRRRARRSRRPAALLTPLLLGAVIVLTTACEPTASLVNGTLTVTGSDEADTIVVRLAAADPTTVEVAIGDGAVADFTFVRADVTALVVHAAAGADTVVLDPVNGSFTNTIPTAVSGEAGDDHLTGEAGIEVLDGGPGDDTLVGGIADDILAGGLDDDLAPWNPGDGSDKFDGGDGADRLLFNGNSAAETFTFGTTPGRVKLFRNAGTVTIDLGTVERLDLRLLGGADTVHVSDLSGSGLTTVVADMSGALLDDGFLDEVVAPTTAVVGRDATAGIVTLGTTAFRAENGSATDRIHVTGTGFQTVSAVGTAGDDAVHATTDGADVVVTGATVGAHLRLTTVGALAMDLAGGDDGFSTSGNLDPLIVPRVSGGPGNDTLSGGNGFDFLDGGADADLIDGNQDGDTVIGGGGTDVVVWDPGDGSDVIEAGSGTDTLQFNGSSSSENIEVFANGGRVVVTRDLGTVFLDTNDLETIEVSTFGSADTVTVRSLVGTDVGTVVTKLGTGPTLTPDGAVDRVTLFGTTGDDALTIGPFGGAVGAVGIVPTLVINGQDTANDFLIVHGQSGTDTFTTQNGVHSLINLTIGF